MDVTVVEGDLTAELASLAGRGKRVAIDTETSGLRWQSEELQLCQLYSTETGPILVRHPTPRAPWLSQLLTDPEVVKVFHFAPFDLKFLMRVCDQPPRSIRCTKAASRLLDPALASGEHSLKALIHRHLGTDIVKGEIRTSDWGTSALSPAQIAYAVGDVEHLLQLESLLSQRLRGVNLESVYMEVCSYMPLAAFLETHGFANPLEY